MLFNSIDFAIFLPIVFVLYWFVTNRNLKWQNMLIVAASYLFYGWWDWRFLSLILFSTLVDYSVGLKLKSIPQKKGALMDQHFGKSGFAGFFQILQLLPRQFHHRFFIFRYNVKCQYVKHHLTRWHQLLYISDVELHHRCVQTKTGAYQRFCGLLRICELLPPIGCRPYRKGYQPASSVFCKADV
jgi:hypothetical protein